MTWNLALYAFASVFILAAFLSGAGIVSRSMQNNQPIETYLLAGGSLKRVSIVSLLFSTSFGLSNLFYQVWLGFTVGAWGLIVQAAWATSFFLLAPHSSTIQRHKSLHNMLGEFGPATRVIAALCSLFGIMYIMGWEAEVGRQTLGSIFGSTGEMTAEQSTAGATWLVSGIVVGCLLYTVLGGLRGNALADVLLNTMKLITIGVLTYWLLARFATQTQVSLVSLPLSSSFWSAMFPSIGTMRENLGWWGLITNFASSLAWQFVDASTWQNVIAGAKSKDDAGWNLRLSGIAVFLTPGILATLLGVALVGSPDITSENILAKALSLAPSYDGVALFFMFVAIIACMMSLIDGLFLASTFALVVDIMHPKQNLSDLDADPEKADKLLLRIRIILIGIAVIAIWGVRFLISDILKGSLFDFVYIIIITQLALIGPVLVRLFDRVARFPLWLPIVIAVAVGFGSIVVGTKLDVKWLVDGAGSFTMAASCIVSLLAIERRSLNSTKTKEVKHVRHHVP